VLAAAALLLSGACSTTDDASSGRLSVVASTNVWGNVAAQVAGDLVDVTSIITGTATDPHSYEASARVQLELSKADLVVVNGGGYDDFATTLLASLDTPPPVINAVELSGKKPGPDLNEHVWYDLPTAATVAQAIARQLGRLDPAHAATYTANAATFTDGIDALVAQADELTALLGQPVAVTEPVPAYLLAAVGLVDATPRAFAAAVENEQDIPATAMSTMLDLVTNHDVVALVYNSQTVSAQTERVLAAARRADLPVIAVTELLPAGKNYLTWMRANLDALAALA
jgi:zinc/manganese transport system substrate-binding protein